MTVAIIRISGLVGLNEEIENTLSRLRLRRKYACVVLHENKELEGMIQKVKDYVAFGKLDNETFKLLLEKRGKALNGKKIDAAKIVEEFSSGKLNKNLKELGIKPFFRLHPPIGGIKSSKLHYPKGVLGNNKEDINKLIRRML